MKSDNRYSRLGAMDAEGMPEVMDGHVRPRHAGGVPPTVVDDGGMPTSSGFSWISMQPRKVVF